MEQASMDFLKQIRNRYNSLSAMEEWRHINFLISLIDALQVDNKRLLDKLVEKGDRLLQAKKSGWDDAERFYKATIIDPLIEALKPILKQIEPKSISVKEALESGGCDEENVSVKIGYLRPLVKIIERVSFNNHLERASEEVNSWPEWKRNLLGPSGPEQRKKEK